MTDPVLFVGAAAGLFDAVGFAFFFWLVAFSPTMRIPFNEARTNSREWIHGRYSPLQGGAIASVKSFERYRPHEANVEFEET